MDQQSPGAPSPSIDPGTNIGRVTLRVSDLDRSLSFYEGVLGFRRGESTSGATVLTAQDGVPLLELQELPGAPPQPPWSTGLYHVAILLPTRADLGRALQRMAEAGLHIGQADHLVSEALYISDPDGNGLEIYRDRPRNTWTWNHGMVQMAVDPLDLRDILEEGKRDAEPWDVLPAGTRVGHIHLQVGDIPGAERFYHDALGFDITARMPGAAFLSAGGYHHHLGLNTWHSRGAGPAPQNTAGLGSFVIELPSGQAVSDLRTRLRAHEIDVHERDSGLEVADPWGNRISLVNLGA
jgi:catechol 2,3-dioxygenase